MQKYKTLKIIVLTIISIVAVVLGYNFLGVTLSFNITFAAVFVGVLSGFLAMKACSNLTAKCLVGVPTALNSIVFMYFCSPLVFYLIEIVENA